MSDPAHIDGKYRVLQRLGQGGYGTVYLCKSNDLDANVAVKVLRRQEGDELQTKRFMNEAKALVKCAHPGIIRIRSFGVTTDGAALYYVMDALNGHSLSHELETKGPLAPRHLIKIFSQVFDALEHGHQNGIVHRDVKPSNIMLTVNDQGEEQAVLIDFGLMRAPSLDVSLTATGDMLGTPSYMSPEQCQGIVADFRSDLYSTGCTIYEAATGRPPFEGDSYSVLFDHLNSLPANVPEYLNEFLKICMAKDRTARFASAKDAESALVEIGKAATIDVRVSDDQRLRTALIESAKPRRMRVAFGITALALLTAAAVFFVLPKNHTDVTMVPEPTRAQKIVALKDNFDSAIENGRLDDAKALLSDYKIFVPRDRDKIETLCSLAEEQAEQWHVSDALETCLIALDQVGREKSEKSEWIFYPLKTRAAIVLEQVDDRAQMAAAVKDTDTIIALPDSEKINDKDKALIHMIKARLLTKLGEQDRAGAEYKIAIKLADSERVRASEKAQYLIWYSEWLKERHNEQLRITVLKQAIETFGRNNYADSIARSAIDDLTTCDLSHEGDYVRQLAKHLQANASKLDGKLEVRSWQQSSTLLSSANLGDESILAAITTVNISNKVEPHFRRFGGRMIHFLVANRFCNKDDALKLALNAYNESKTYRNEFPSCFEVAARDLAAVEIGTGDQTQALAHYRESADAGEIARQSCLRQQGNKITGDDQRFAQLSAQDRVFIVRYGKAGGKRPTDWADAERSIAFVASPLGRANLTKALHAEGR